MTIVDRETHCFLAIEAVVHRSQETAQQLVKQAPAQQYLISRGNGDGRFVEG